MQRPRHGHDKGDPGGKIDRQHTVGVDGEPVIEMSIDVVLDGRVWFIDEGPAAGSDGGDVEQVSSSESRAGSVPAERRRSDEGVRAGVEVSNAEPGGGSDEDDDKGQAAAEKGGKVGAKQRAGVRAGVGPVEMAEEGMLVPGKEERAGRRDEGSGAQGDEGVEEEARGHFSNDN